MTPICVDAFSGAGGLALGLQKAGFDVRLSFDNDPLCISTQMKNAKFFQESHRTLQASIQEMLGGRLLREIGCARGDLDLLAGGPPCQGFSIQRIGEDEDKRNNLVSMFVELINEANPRLFLIENVPGILGKRGRAILDEALARAASLGYWINQKELDAANFGVPQRRRRVFIVGERLDLGLPLFQFPTPNSENGRRRSVRDAIGHLPSPPEDGSDHPEIPNHRRDRLSPLNLKRLAALKPGQGREFLPEGLLADCHKRDASEIGHRGVYGRMSWDDVAPTITARFDSFTRGQFGHPEDNRTISLREGALIQTFPKRYAFVGNKVEIARQIGNAVPPVLAECIAVQLRRCLEARN